MAKQTFLILCSFLLIISTAFAQNKVTGVVTDAADGSNISFASILIKGTSIVTAANANGAYVLNNVPANAVLVFSSIGYQSLEVPVEGRALVNVSLTQVAVGLEEVMVVAYGSVKKSFLFRFCDSNQTRVF